MKILSTTYEYLRLHTYVYDTPDGEACLKKAVHSAKTFGLLGAWVGGADILLRSHPETLAAGCSRLLFFAAPAFAAGGTFATVTCLAGQYRGKDGGINHSLGGLAAGMVIGAKVRKISAAASIGVALAVFCGLKKEFDKAAKDPNPSKEQMIMTQSREFPQVHGTLGHHNRYFGPKDPKYPEPKNY